MVHASLKSALASRLDEPARSPADTELAFLAGGGAMGALIRAADWAATPLGAARHWPQSLRSAISTGLNCAFPILLWWGPELVMLYNDDFVPILGGKHPAALGMHGADCWPEIWHVIGPMLRQVLQSGQPTRARDMLLALERNAWPEECYFSFSCSPIHDESGSVAGVFTPVIETTANVIGERRLRTLRDLAALTQGAADVAAAVRCAAGVLADNPHDLPFAALYVIGPDRAQATRAASAGLAEACGLCPPAIAITAGGPGWQAAAHAALRGTADVLAVPPQLFPPGTLTANPWPDPPARVMVLPVTPAGQASPAALLVAGLSPRLALDDAYRAFLARVAGQLGTALAQPDRAKAAVFADVSHAFRTPLSLILGPLEAQLSDPALPAPARGHAEVAHRNALRLLQLVDGPLDVSRLDAGRAQWHPAAGTLQTPLRVAAAPAGRRRLLVADGNADMRACIQRLLDEAYDVDLAVDGSQALARALEQPPDLLLADVMVPALDGLELVARLRADPRTAAVPVILLSACARPEAGAPGLDAGASDYLVKPFAAEELRARVAAVLRGAELRSAAAARERNLRLAAETAAARTAMALRAARMVAWDHDLATGITHRSDEALSLLGLRSGPVEQFRTLIHPDDRDRVLATQTAALRGEGGFEIEYRVITGDGRTLWLVDTGEPRRAPDGTLLGVSGVLADITARKQAEETLREQQSRSGFLLALGDRLRDAASPADVMAAAAAALGAHLGASGVGYAEVEGAASGASEFVTIEAAWRAPGFPGVDGRHRLDDYAPSLKRLLRAGRTVVVRDTAAHPGLEPAGRAAYAAARIRALIESPLLVDGRLHAALFVLSEAPRGWTASEVALADEVAERSWAAVRRMRAEAALRTSEERLRQLADTVREVFYVTDPVRRRVDYVSSAYERVWGLPAAALYADCKIFFEGVHPEDHGKVLATIASQAAGEATELRYRLIHPDGSTRRIWDRAWPLRDAAGAVYRVVGVAEDETERAELLESLAAERSLLRAVFDAAPIGIIVAEAPSGRVIETNRRVAEMFRHPVHTTADVDAHRQWVAFHADGSQVEPEEYPLVRALRGGEERPELEVLYQRGDASTAWVRLAAAPVRDAAGAVVGGVVAAQDIDRERRAIAALEVAAERHRALIDELNHRVKNTLAVVQSLALQTLRSAAGLEEFADSFGSRLQGLARAHDLLTREAWEGATLADVARAALAPWLADGRVVLQGAVARLSPRQALALSMAFGELATNAAKHGALSMPGGRVLVTSQVAGAGVSLDWIESGGPPVRAPARRGLGSRLLGRPLAAELGGTLDLLFEPSGVRCLFRFAAGRGDAAGAMPA